MKDHDLSSVGVAIPIGANVPETLCADLKKKFPNLMAVPNYYSMTEFGRTITNSFDSSMLGAVYPGVVVKVEP